jgi:arginase
LLHRSVGSKALIGVPLYTLAAYKGMGEAPPSLRKGGLPRALGVTDDLGDVQLRPLMEDALEGNVRNLSHFMDSSVAIHRAAKSVRAEFLVVFGGECSETVGVMAGLTEAFRGKPGMLWMDAHGDFNTPETSPSGYIGGMCLAMTTGRGPRLGRMEPPLADERLVHIGSRALDPPEARAFASSGAGLVTSKEVKRGAAAVARDAARRLGENSDWIACHLDIDVVDPAYIGAVNYPTPGGLTIEEASTLLGVVMKTGKMKLLEVAAYNPLLDRQGNSLKNIANLVEDASRHARS